MMLHVDRKKKDAIVKSEDEDESLVVTWPRWQTPDWMWAGVETITTPRGPHRGQVISGVIASVISYIFTFIIVNCADKSIRNESMTDGQHT